MSRSKFVVVVLVVLSMLLTNCAPAQPTAVPPTAVPAKPWAGKTINILMEGVPDTEYIQALLSQWEEQSGMKVNIEVLNYALMHERLVPQLTSPAGGGSYDVIVVDNYWVGEFVKAGWLTTLDDRLAKSTSVKKDAYLKSMWDMVGQVDNVTYMIPFYNYAMGLIYRTDLMADPQLQAAYKTKFNKDTEYHGAEAYAAAYVIVDVLKRAKSLGPDDIKQALKETDMMTVFGPVKFVAFDKKTNQNKVSTYVVQWQNGQLMLVWPQNLANAKYAYPVDWLKEWGY